MLQELLRHQLQMYMVIEKKKSQKHLPNSGQIYTLSQKNSDMAINLFHTTYNHLIEYIETDLQNHLN